MKLFVVMEKEKGSTNPMLVDEFSKRWPGKKPPSRVGVFKMRKSLQEHQTLLDRRKTNTGVPKTIRTA